MISYRKIWNSFLFQLLTVWRLRGKIIKVKSKLFWAEKHKNLWQWREDNFIKKIIEFFNKGRRKSIKSLLNILKLLDGLDRVKVSDFLRWCECSL